ncbi:MAG: S1-like domain-containing RNA-binding protein [Thiotrichaceae bacterium]
MEVGALNRMRVVKKLDFGIYLDGKELGEILMPTRYIPADCKIDDEIVAFLYKDSDDRLLATTETPLVMVEQCAHLKVVDVNNVGAFLDWGLPKDLLVPHSEQNGRMEVGRSYVVSVYIDDISERITATAKLDGWLNEEGIYFKPDQPVDLLICGRTELGYKAIINHTHLGLIYENEVFQTLKYGQRIAGYIKAIRDDKKIDLTLQLPAKETRDELMENIISYLKKNGGISKITDKSIPDVIYQEFAVSKKNYKKALGRLYKQKLITIDKDKIELL